MKLLWGASQVGGKKIRRKGCLSQDNSLEAANDLLVAIRRGETTWYLFGLEVSLFLEQGLVVKGSHGLGWMNYRCE